MRFCLDQFGERVFIDDAKLGETYYCPECGEKMVQRHGEIRAPHFAHYPNTQCTDVWRYDESDWHVKYQSMFPKENQEIIKELDEKKHRADVLFEDRKVVIEIQGDRLRQDEFEQRNKFFNALGYKVVWLFDESRIFENGSINYGYRRMACSRKWTRPSRTFQGFAPQSRKDEVELWFQRKDSDFDDQPRFFQVLSSDNSLKTMECGFCYSLKELMRYLRDGKRTPNYSKLYDIKYQIRRTDWSDSVFCCPKNHGSPFADAEVCTDCPYKVHVANSDRPRRVGCAYRFERMDWSADCEIVDFSRRLAGFIESVTVADSSGEANLLKIANPKTFLRPLTDLWERYQPLKRLIAFNAKNGRTYVVFNPGWQKYKNGVIKGRMVDGLGRYARGEDEISDAEDFVWFVVRAII